MIFMYNTTPHAPPCWASIQEAARSQLGTMCGPSKLLLTNLENSFEFDRIISNSDERGGQTAKYSIIAELDVHSKTGFEYRSDPL